jgi:hypothetical protein
MAGNKFQIKRTSVTGREANTSVIDVGELALNITDGIMYSTNGSVVFEIGANTTTLSVNGISYPATDGTSGQAIVTNGSGTLSFATIEGGAGGGVSANAVVAYSLLFGR